MRDLVNLKVKNKKPLINFFVLGLVVFGLKAWFEKPASTEADNRQIEITSADLEWFRAMWKQRMNHEPTGAELQAHVNQVIRERVLSREAKRLGLDRNDQLVIRRLAQKMDYLFKDMVSAVQPTREELEAYLAAHRDRYEIPGEITFEQVLYKTEQRGEAGAELAVAMFLDHPNRESDATMLPRMNEDFSPVQVRGLFGEAFAKTVINLESGTWGGPVRSSYGLHAVFVHSRSPAIMPSVEDIRSRLTDDWLLEQRADSSADTYARVRTDYQVLVEGMPYALDMQ